MYEHYTQYFGKNNSTLYTRSRLYSRLLPRAKNVLEFGVGNGYFAAWCKSIGANYTGVDGSNALLNSMEQDGICAKIPHEFFLVPLHPYDLIFAEHFIEHLKDYDELHDFLIGCKNRLKKGGMLALLYPDYNKIGNIFWHDPTHHYITNPMRIEKSLLEAGFEVQKNGAYSLCLLGAETWPLRFSGLLPLPYKLKLNTLVHGYTLAVK